MSSEPSEDGKPDDGESAENPAQAENSTEPDDLSEDLGDEDMAQQRAMLHQFMVDAALLFKGGGYGLAVADSAVQNTGVNVHLGDVIIGSGGGAATMRLLATGPIDPGFLARSRMTFVKPPCFGMLHRLVSGDHIAIISAPRGSGVTTLALQLLYGTSKSVRKLDPDHDVRHLDLSKLTKATGYLMEAPPLDRLAQWRDVHLEVLSGRLAELDIRMIITTSANRQELESELGRYVVRAGPPPIHEVLEAHVKAHLDATAQDAVAELLLSVNSEGLLDNLTPDTPVHHAVHLATAVAQIAHGKASVLDVKAHMEVRTAQRFSEWFQQQEGVEQQALIISLAVLHNLSWDWVTAASKKLVALVDAEGSTEPQPKPTSLFKDGQSKRLELARAELVTAEQITEYGRLNVTTARFRDDGWPIRVLDQVWTEGEDTHDHLLEWLKGFENSDRLAERVRAASVIGRFACHSFERVYRDVLLPWADNQSHQARLMAATALAITGSEQELSPLVGRLLQDWSGPQHGINLRWTAARAMGLGLGRVSPGRAFKVLGTAASAGNPAITSGVAQSLIEMFVEGDQTLRSRLLGKLKEWTDPGGRRGLLRPGQACFLRIAKDVRIDVAGRRQPWPALLWLSHVNAEDRDSVALLWRRVLWMPKVGRPARQVLLGWLRMAARNDESRQTLAELVNRTAESERELGLLRHHLERWRTAAPDCLPVIDAILGA